MERAEAFIGAFTTTPMQRGALVNTRYRLNGAIVSQALVLIRAASFPAVRDERRDRGDKTCPPTNLWTNLA